MRDKVVAKVQARRIQLVAWRSFSAGITIPLGTMPLWYAVQHTAPQLAASFWSWFWLLLATLLPSLLHAAPQVLLRRPPASPRRWLAGYYVTKLLLGSGWGAVVWFLLDGWQWLLEMMIYLTLAAVGAVVVIIHSLFLGGVLVFLAGILLPGLVKLLLLPSLLGPYVLSGGLLYFTLLGVYSALINRQLLRGLEAGAEAELLTEELVAANVRSEQALLALQQEHQQLQQALQTIKHMAHVDELTQLPNRRAAMAELQRLLTMRRELAQPAVLLMLDIDHFKQINDQHGHEVGDRVLAALAARLSVLLRNGDTLARFGGEEFVVLLPNTRLDEAAALATRLCEGLAVSPMLQLPLLTVTASFGITELRGDDSLHDWLRRADEAMYRAKRAGRNQCVALR